MNGQYVLLYRGTCSRCRLLSRILTLLSLGVLARLPIGSRDAERLYERFPRSRGKLALVGPHGVYVGPELPRGAWRVFMDALSFRWRSSAP